MNTPSLSSAACVLVWLGFLVCVLGSGSTDTWKQNEDRETILYTVRGRVDIGSRGANGIRSLVPAVVDQMFLPKAQTQTRDKLVQSVLIKSDDQNILWETDYTSMQAKAKSQKKAEAKGDH